MGSIQRLLSEQRLAKFIELASGDWDRALVLYKDDIRYAQDFYILLHIIEISLRNAIDEKLKTHFDEGWVFSNQIPFTSSQILLREKYLETNSLTNYLSKLPLGFWTACFGRAFEDIWRKYLRFIFNTQEPLRRQDIAQKLQKIRILRNRVAHYEPLISLPVELLKRECMDLIGLISQDLQEWVATKLLPS